MPRKKVQKPSKSAAKTVKKPSVRKSVQAKEVKSETQKTTVPSDEKQEIIVQFQVNKGDTGSPEVQIALLTKRIEKLVAHLRSNPSDNHSRRGLLGIVSKRRRLMNYLEKKDTNRFKGVVKKLELEK